MACLLQVATSIANGVSNMVVLNPRTPPDVLAELRDTGNRFVREGATTSFLEHYKELEEIDEAWKKHCDTNGMTSRGCGAETADAKDCKDAIKELRDVLRNFSGDLAALVCCLHCLHRIGSGSAPTGHPDLSRNQQAFKLFITSLLCRCIDDE